MTTAATTPATGTPPARDGAPRRRFAPQQTVLLAILLAELVVFGIAGTNFLTPANAFQLPRTLVELGLLALALTPVILAGGIDLSVGALMGLCAVLFGKLWRDAGLPPWAAALVTLAFGAAAGAVNGRLITGLRIPPLIVTLGTLSLFRGLAEGITGGKDTFTDFPAGFMFLGQGAVGPLPAQLFAFVPIALFFHLLVHRSASGRALSAIGYSPDGARHAGLRVGRLVAGTYVLSGLCAALAALIYVARFGQAKADAGTGYELLAITAVVLGGTSIFGGRGHVLGTSLGILLIHQTRQFVSWQWSKDELIYIVVGVLLILSVLLNTLLSPRGRE